MINNLIKDKEIIKKAKEQAIYYAKQKFSTEKEHDKLVSLVSNAID